MRRIYEYVLVGEMIKSAQYYCQNVLVSSWTETKFPHKLSKSIWTLDFVPASRIVSRENLMIQL